MGKYFCFRFNGIILEIFTNLTERLLPDSVFMIIWDILHILIIFEYIIIVILVIFLQNFIY